ncbi:hypothetical protein [Nonomuraea sp. NPDC002799]
MSDATHEIRRPGDDFRKLGALLGRGPAGNSSDEGLHHIDVGRRV